MKKLGYFVLFALFMMLFPIQCKAPDLPPGAVGIGFGVEFGAPKIVPLTGTTQFIDYQGEQIVILERDNFDVYTLFTPEFINYQKDCEIATRVSLWAIIFQLLRQDDYIWSYDTEVSCP